MWLVDGIDGWQRSGEDLVWLSGCFSSHLIAVRIRYMPLC